MSKRQEVLGLRPPGDGGDVFHASMRQALGFIVCSLGFRLTKSEHSAAPQSHAPLCRVLGSTVWISTRSLTSTATQVASAQKAAAATSCQASHLPSDIRGDASQAAGVCRAPELRAAAGSAARGDAQQKAAYGTGRHMCWLPRHQAARPLRPPSPLHQQLPGRLWVARLSTTGYVTEGLQLLTSPAAPFPRQSSAAAKQRLWCAVRRAARPQSTKLRGARHFRNSLVTSSR